MLCTVLIFIVQSTMCFLACDLMTRRIIRRRGSPITALVPVWIDASSVPVVQAVLIELERQSAASIIQRVYKAFHIQKIISAGNTRRRIGEIGGSSLCVTLSSFLPDQDKLKVVLPFPHWSEKAKGLWQERRRAALCSQIVQYHERQEIVLARMKQDPIVRAQDAVPCRAASNLVDILSIMESSSQEPLATASRTEAFVSEPLRPRPLLVRVMDPLPLSDVKNAGLVCRHPPPVLMTASRRFELWMDGARAFSNLKGCIVPKELRYPWLIKQGRALLPKPLIERMETDVDELPSRSHPDDTAAECVLNVVLAFTALYGEMVYSQGLVDLVSALATALENDQVSCFESLYTLMTVFGLDQIYSTGRPGIAVYCAELDQHVARLLPDLHEHWDAIELRPEMFCEGFIMTLCTNETSLSTQSTAHILDSFFADGWSFMFRMLVTMLEREQPRLLQCSRDESLEILHRTMVKDFFSTTETFKTMIRLDDNNQQQQQQPECA